MPKKLVIEFSLDQALELDQIVSAMYESAKAARIEFDLRLDRVGNGEPSASGMVTLRLYGFGSPQASVNGGPLKISR